MAEKNNVYIAGDDFKSGQTKIKSVLVDFLVGAGIKPTSIVSYNHLGNNDGLNLSSPNQFRSKEVKNTVNIIKLIIIPNTIYYRFQRATLSTIWLSQTKFSTKKENIPIM